MVDEDGMEDVCHGIYCTGTAVPYQYTVQVIYIPGIPVYNVPVHIELYNSIITQHTIRGLWAGLLYLYGLTVPGILPGSQYGYIDEYIPYLYK